MSEPRITTRTFKSQGKLRWRTRLKLWWLMRRLTPAQRERIKFIDRELTMKFLHGDDS